MKIAISLILILFLSACGSDSGSGNAPLPRAPAPGPMPGPTPDTEPWWGLLTCQQRGACKDPVLNQSMVKLMYFFARKKDPVPEEEAAPFHCGRVLGRAWNEEMGGNGFAPEVGRFFAYAFDLTTCRQVVKTVGDINDYLKNHEEYKNEFN